ncbi:5'/3'-nucleotidase SurE [Leptolyngbya sp. 15MV]|nr:5'/3'-nucleotidase SurE [Leptolyngbya sp. 15MV]
MIRLFAPALALTLATPSLAHDPDPVRILVTNDDGVRSEGLAALVAALEPLGEVVVSAPAENHSGASQSVTLFSRPFEVETLAASGATTRYAVRGTPADSVLFGLLGPGREKPFDLVISGINKGENVGNAVPVSGTVGAARQAAMLGVTAIAVSQEMVPESEYDFTLAAQFAAKVAARILALGDSAPKLVSINVPTDPVGVAFVPAGGSAFDMRALHRLPDTKEANVATYRIEFGRGDKPDDGGDAAALAKGLITSAGATGADQPVASSNAATAE